MAYDICAEETQIVRLSRIQDDRGGGPWVWGFSVQPLWSLRLCGQFLAGNKPPQRHRDHRGCTEKKFKLGTALRACLLQELSQMAQTESGIVAEIYSNHASTALQ
jgi:hypothetical protein